MSKAAELAALIGSQSALENRNFIINGAMQVAQRGTSFTSTGYTLDRMQMLTANTDNVAFTTTQSSTAPDGFANSLKVDITTAETTLDSNELFRLLYKAEGHDLQQLNYGSSAAISVTLSFYVRSNVTGVYAVEFRLNAAGTSTITKQYTINSANTWERKTLTLPANTATAIDNDNTNGLEISFALAAGSNFTTGSLGTSWASTATASRYAGHAANVMSSTSNEWLITGVQLEVGEQATPFEHRSFADELVRCQRYYQAHGNGANGLSFSINDMPASIATDTTNITGKFFVKMMRAAPTMVIYSRNSTANKVSLVATGADYATSTFAPNVIGVTGFHVVSRSGGSNLTKGDGLEYGYTADAEL
jgi:hypothetical protein